MPALQKLGSLKSSDSKRSDGAIEIRQIIRALPIVFEETITVGTKTHSIFDEYGYNAIQGWIINDGKGQIRWAFSRDGIVFGPDATMRPGERIDLNGLDVHTVKLTFISLDADYRIWQI